MVSSFGFMRIDATTFFKVIIAILSAVFLLVGTWSPLRIMGGKIEASEILFAQPRLWILYMLVLLSILAKGSAIFLKNYKKGENPHTDRYIYDLRSSPKKNHFMILFAFFIGYMVISSLWSHDYWAALLKVFDLSLILIVTFILHRAITGYSKVNPVYFFWGAILFFNAIIATDGLLNIDHIERGRLSALGGGSNAFGAMMSLGFFGAIFFVKLRSLIIRSFFVFISVFFIIMVVLSGSRGSLISAVIALMFYFIFNKQSRKLAPFIILGGILSMSFFTMSPIWDQAIQTFKYRFFDLLIYGGKYSSRDDVFMVAFKTGMDHFFIGGGLGSFKTLTGWVYPHNIFLEVFAEGGIFGLIFLIQLLVYFAYYIIRYNQQLDASSISGAICMFIYIQNSGDLFDSRRFFIVAVVALSSIFNSEKINDYNVMISKKSSIIS